MLAPRDYQGGGYLRDEECWPEEPESNHRAIPEPSHLQPLVEVVAVVVERNKSLVAAAEGNLVALVFPPIG